MEKKVCFVCPIYDGKGHFDYGINLLKSKKTLGIEEDIYFVFSSADEKLKFEKLCKKNHCGAFLSIIVPSFFNDYKSIAVAKKLFGLKVLMNDYSYIALVDCETLFVKKTDFYSLFKYIDDNRLCLNSNVSYDGFLFLRKCFLTIGLNNNKRIKKEFRNYKYNFWFNEIQVYNCLHLPSFFNWLDEMVPQEKYLNCGACFEYYLYGAFLILERGFHLKKFKHLKGMGGIVEYLPSFKVKKQLKICKALNTHWTSTYESITDNTYLLFHLDRLNCKGYGYDCNKLQMILQRYVVLLKDKLRPYFRKRQIRFQRYNDL